MNLHCTKKVLDQLEMKDAPSENTGESLFTWHANLITVNRKKTIVFVNDANRYCLVLYGVKKKDFQSLGERLRSAIRTVFLEEGISEDVVEHYLEHAGDVQIFKTKNRQTVSWLNKACEWIEYMWKHVQDDSLINFEASLKMSRLLVSIGKGDYFNPNEKMYEDLESFVGHGIFKRRAAVLNIRINLGQHAVWRRVVVPVDVRFDQLHKMIQAAFGWRDSHHHMFLVFKPNGGERPVEILVNNKDVFAQDYGIPKRFGINVRLSEYLQSRLIYVYDFGDNWEHELIVEDIIEEYEKPYATCPAGEGDRPPEDVGGPSGYALFLDVMANPDNPRHEHMKQWVSDQHDMDFDLNDVNHRLQHWV